MKKLAAMLLTLFFLMLPAVSAAGAAEEADMPPYISDTAMLLTSEERRTLEDEARRISEQYSCGVYIITVDSYAADPDAADVRDAARSLYRSYDLGLGEEKDGILLFLSIQDRDFCLLAFGYGNTAFTDYGKERLSDTFTDNFGDDDWSGGFTDYLRKSEEMLEVARAGHPLDVGISPLIWLAGVALSIAIGCLVAYVICCLIKAKMNSVAKKTEANPYIKDGSVVISAREDVFSHTTKTRVKIEKHSGSGFGGFRGSKGGTTVDSSGFSGKSGKF